VGNHSHYHARMRLLTAEGVRTDVLTAERAIRTVVGVDPRPWFRLPFGSGHRIARLAGLIGGLGYRRVGWDVDPFDWDERRTARDVEDAVVDGVLADAIANGSAAGTIVLMHGWSATGADALPRIVARLRDAGASFDTLDRWPELPRTEAATPNEGPNLTELVEEREGWIAPELR